MGHRAAAGSRSASGAVGARWTSAATPMAMNAAATPTAAADRDTREAALKARIVRIQTAQNSTILQPEELPAGPHDPGAQAHRAWFAALREKLERLEDQHKALAKPTPSAPEPACRTGSRWPGTPLPRLSPPVKARLFQALVSVLQNKLIWPRALGAIQKPLYVPSRLLATTFTERP